MSILTNINGNIFYRIYNGAAILLNVKTSMFYVLEGEYLEAWEKIVHKKEAHTIGEEIRDKFFRERFIVSEDDDNFASDRIYNTKYSEDNEKLVKFFIYENKIPFTVHWESTRRCNLRCSHCYCDFNDEELTTREVFGMIDELYKAGTLLVVITGGEFFYREEALEILKYFEKKGFVLRINTNGTLLTEKMINEISKMKNIYRVHISLYSIDEVHDKITNMKNSVKKTKHAIKSLVNMGVSIRINCSVMKSNFDVYKNVKKYGDDLGVEVHYDPFIFPLDTGCTENIEREQISKQQMKEYDEFIGYINKTQIENKKLCKACFSFSSINSNGDIVPCFKLKNENLVLGNIKNEQFSHIWNNSPKIFELRKSIENKIRECNICSLT